jgi:glutamate racemase
VVGVIEPGAEAAAKQTSTGIVGVIGTNGTISSGAYQRALKSFTEIRSVVAQPCPLLVPLVEEGWLDHRITRLILEEYTRPMVAERIDTLVLGCTHYPLLRPLLGEVLGAGVALVDSAASTAASVARLLGEMGMLTDSEAGECSYYVSDIPIKFQEIAQRFLGRSITLVTQVELGENR